MSFRVIRDPQKEVILAKEANLGSKILEENMISPKSRIWKQLVLMPVPTCPQNAKQCDFSQKYTLKVLHYKMAFSCCYFKWKIEIFVISSKKMFYDINHWSNTTCSWRYKTFFWENLDFLKIKKLNKVCSNVWTSTKM